MNIAQMRHLTKLKYFTRSVLGRPQSTTALKENESSEISQHEDILKAPKITISKKERRPPFVKNFMLGKFDTDLLAYPEVSSKDDYISIENQATQLSSLTDELQCKSRSEQWEFYKNHKLLGLQAPTTYGGKELSYTELCKYYEMLSKNSSYISLLHHDLLCINAINKNGSVDQKAKYLPDLINGKRLSALCISESSSCDPRHLKTKATESNNNWIINGSKDWIVNGYDADTFIVFAQTSILNKEGLMEDKVSAFIVDSKMEGITVEKCSTLGLKDTNMATIKFNNVSVPKENVLGQINSGEEIAASLLTEFRLLSAPFCINLTKNLINKFIDYCKSDMGKILLPETEIVKHKLSKMIMQLYAMESMTYFTTGLLDTYEKQDCEIEAAIIKVFSSQQCLQAASSIIEFIGTPGYITDHWSNIAHCDALGKVILNETNDNLKIIIALLGLQHAGATVNEEIKKIRNPLFNPGNTFKRMWTHRKQMDDNPELNLDLKDYLHPSLLKASEQLEYCVLRLQFATESLLARCGPDVVNKHIDLERLANSIIDTFAMAACLSRASRSYCIGVKNCESEIAIANTICNEAMFRVKENLRKICEGPYITNDEIHTKVSEQAFHWKQYFLEHPITREF